MRFGDVPVAELGRFVVVEAEVHAEATFLRPSLKFRSAGAVKTGLPPRMTRTSTRPAFMSADELRDRGGAIRRRAVEARAVRHRRADIAERLVHRARERMHRRRLTIAGDDRRAALVRLKIRRDRGDPPARLVGRRGARRRAGADRCGETGREAVNIAGLERQPVIGLATVTDGTGSTT